MCQEGRRRKGISQVGRYGVGGDNFWLDRVQIGNIFP